jgi:hypothetical protein
VTLSPGRLLILLTLGCVGASRAHAQVITREVSGERVVQGEIRGRFQDRLSPLPYALVEVLSAGARRSVITDETGRYVLAGLGAGEVRLAVTHAGYQPLTLLVSVPERGTVTVDLELSAEPLALPPVEVRADALGSITRIDPTTQRATDAAIPELEMQALDFGPGVGQPGLLEAVSALPGNDPADATDVLFMRGSTTDLKLVLLDGVPVYTPFHVAGLMRSFEPGVLGRADLHVGGAPARFDGGLTHILDLRTRTPRRDRLRASGSLDLVAASVAVEAPLGSRAGVIASGRSLHDLGRAPLGGQRPYGYQDVLLTVVAEPVTGHELKATGFWNTESVVLDANDAPDDARWANRAASVAYRTGIGGVGLELTAGLSGYRATLPLQPSLRPGEPPPAALLASARTDRGRLLTELTWGPAAQPIRAGVSLEHIDVEFEARELGGGPSVTHGGSTPAVGAFVDATRLLAPGLTLRGGLRADHFGGTGTRLAPRGALMWELGPEALLTVAAGRYHQPTRSPHAEVERTLAEVADVDAGATPGDLLPVATADHIVLSLDQRLGERVALGLEGFWKRYDGLPSPEQETVRSSGIDVRVLAGGDLGAAWLGYGLSWFWSTVDLSGRASEFVGRHLLSAGVSGSLGGPLRGELRVAYGAGLPYTSIPFGSATLSESVNQIGGSGDQEATVGRSPLTGGLDEEFLRVDLEVHMLFEPTWGGTSWQVRPYVRLLNALDRRDALFYTFQPWRSDDVRPLAERPLLPLLGVAVSF